MLKALKSGLRTNPAFQAGWTVFRRWQLHRDYERRRERYGGLARECGLVYRESEVASSVQSRIRGRGYTPTPRREGEIHTFAFVPQMAWHASLIPDFRELGPVTLFDYKSLGFDWREFIKADKHGIQRRKEMNEMVLPALREAHAKRPVDWFFAYASGVELSRDTMRAVSEELGIPTVNMCLDDKQSWTGPWMGDHPGGQVGIASAFDLSWTSARVACEWYMVEGGRPIYMPEGFDASSCVPLEVEKDIPVSFVGEAYGFRLSSIRYLRRNGVDIRPFGKGWPGSGWVEDMNEVFNRSRINLGFGGIGYSESLTNVKARDFDIPGTGGGMYLTSFNPDLALHYNIGGEIVCYRNREEMLELIRYYLAHPDEADQIAKRGRARCLAEHRWLHRYRNVLNVLGIPGGETV